MSNLFALGSRPVHSPLIHSAQDGGPAGAQNASASGKVAARLPTVEPVSSSSSSITLSQQALNSRLDQLGDKTVDAAQRFVGNIAQTLFGDAVKGATFHLDTMSLAADTSRSASSKTARADPATLQINASASFVGRGIIATADGQSFDFEIEVKYVASAQVNDSAEASAATSTEDSAAQQPLKAPDTLSLTGRPLPAIAFPGSLADLFKLLGRELTASSNSGKGNGNDGELSLRLLRLVNTAALLAPRAHADSPAATPAERNRALASYATPAAAGPIITV